jgi:hypothetical protein
MRLCHSCAAGPQGVNGHGDLHHDHLAHPNTESGYATIFVCGACRAEWRRIYAGNGKFEWERLNDDELPGSGWAP